MAAFLNKARNNICVANILVESNLHISSAHPAYYSSFLMLKYILAHFDSISYTKQGELTKDKESHNVLSGLALPFLVDKDKIHGNDYLVWYNKLKMMRNKADYKPENIEDSLLEKNLEYAKEFISSIMMHFKIV